MDNSVEPGRRLGAYFVGEDLTSFPDKVPAEVTVEKLASSQRYSFESFLVWIDEET